MPIGTPTTPPPMTAGAAGTSVNTGAWTPPANCTLICVGMQRGTGAAMPSISDTGATWVAIPGAEGDAGGFRAKVWKLEVGASPPTLNTTITSAAATQVGILVQDWPGAVPKDSSIKVATSTTGDPSLTMDAFGAGSACWAFKGVSGTGTTNPPTGYTETFDGVLVTNITAVSVYDLASPGTAIAWSGGGASTVAFGLEMLEATAAVSGSMAATETGTDIFAGTGTVSASSVSGAMAAVETGTDVFAAAGTVKVSGSMAAVETGTDTFAATGTVKVSGSMAAVEIGTDTFAADGTVKVSGSMVATETGNDAFVGAGTVVVSGTMAAVETGTDAFAADGTVGNAPAVGTMAAVETGTDAFAADGTVKVSGSMVATEAGTDAFSAAGTVTISGAMAAVEAAANDNFEGTGTITVSGIMDAIETGADAFSGTGAVGIIPPTPPERIIAASQGGRTSEAGSQNRTVIAGPQSRRAA